MEKDPRLRASGARFDKPRAEISSDVWFLIIVEVTNNRPMLGKRCSTPKIHPSSKSMFHSAINFIIQFRAVRFAKITNA
jgi:hypothetical protein